MSRRVVVWVQESSGERPPIVSLCDPLDHEFAQRAFDLNCLKQIQLFEDMKKGPLQPDLVKRVGTWLYDCLVEHPAVRDELKAALQVKEGESAPIYLRIDPPGIDELPWEALYEEDAGFLGVDQKWPIARVKHVKSTLKSEFVFQPPMRILVVLGASGSDAATRISAAQEWSELLNAMKRSHLSLRVRVLTCEDDLKKEIDGLQLPWVETGFLSDQRGLFEQITDFAPQVLHFFCHGIADRPPYLQVGNRTDWKLEQPGSINIGASELRQDADKSQNVWLITLNCCESAQQALGGGARSRSLASSLVVAGFPAVVGMRERVESQNANLFCGLFYETLLAELETLFKEGRKDQSGHEVHWACALYRARRQLCVQVDAHRPVSTVAQESKEWTLPVLYTRFSPFLVKVPADPEGKFPIERPAGAALAPAADPLPLNEKLELVAELQQLQQKRDELAALTSLPPEVRESVVKTINDRLAVIQAQLS